MSFRVSHDGSGSAVLHVIGEVDLAVARPLRELLDEVMAAWDGDVSVDLDAVTFMDCSGLHALLDARRLHGDRVRVVTTSAAVDRLLELTATRGCLAGPGRTDGSVRRDVSAERRPDTATPTSAR